MKVVCMGRDEYPKKEFVKSVKTYLDGSGNPWRMVTTPGGFLLSFLGHPTFFRSTFNLGLNKDGRPITITNTNMILFYIGEDDVLDVFCTLTSLIKADDTASLWDTIQQLITVRIENGGSLRYSEELRFVSR